MTITETEVRDDSVPDNITNYKIILADKILSNYSLLFNDEISREKIQLNNNVKDIAQLRGGINSIGQELKDIASKIKIEKIKKEIIIEIQTLDTYDVLYGRNKTIVKKLINEIDHSSITKLKKFLELLKSLVK